jgi:hypothetical protein
MDAIAIPRYAVLGSFEVCDSIAPVNRSSLSPPYTLLDIVAIVNSPFDDG